MEASISKRPNEKNGYPSFVVDLTKTGILWKFLIVLIKGERQ
jgi:hypothetical protein